MGRNCSQSVRADANDRHDRLQDVEVPRRSRAAGIRWGTQWRMTDLLADFDTDTLSYDGMVHRYRLGSGPAVVVIAEIPGITPGDRVCPARGRGRVHGLCALAVRGRRCRQKKPSAMVKALRTVCVSREFTVFATGKSSPVVLWLRELATRPTRECGAGCGCGRNVRDRGSRAGHGRRRSNARTGAVSAVAACSDHTGPPPHHRYLARGPRHCQARCENGLQVLGTRFHCDQMSPSGRFALLRNRLGTAFIGVELPAPRQIRMPGPPHSVLTEHLIDEPGQPPATPSTRYSPSFSRSLV